jgi:hypothetical protein
MGSAPRSPGDGDGSTSLGAPDQTVPLGQEGFMACLLLLFAVAFNLYCLYAEVAVRAPC